MAERTDHIERLRAMAAEASPWSWSEEDYARERHALEKAGVHDELIANAQRAARTRRDSQETDAAALRAAADALEFVALAEGAEALRTALDVNPDRPAPQRVAAMTQAFAQTAFGAIETEARRALAGRLIATARALLSETPDDAG